VHSVSARLKWEMLESLMVSSVDMVLGQHMSISAVSRCPDVRGTTNLRQLWRQNRCSCWTSVVELTTSPATQSRHQLRTVQTTAEGSSLWERQTRRSVTFSMQCHRKNVLLTYLLTYRSPQMTIVIGHPVVHYVMTYNTN